MYNDWFLIGYSCKGKSETTHKYQEYETDDEYVNLQREEEQEALERELVTN